MNTPLTGVDVEALMVKVLDALGVIAGIAVMLTTLVAVWYAIGWGVGLFLRCFRSQGGRGADIHGPAKSRPLGSRA